MQTRGGGNGATERWDGELLSVDITRVGVLGAGNIGSGVVTDLVLHGISAVVVDVSEDILQRAQADVLNNVRFAPGC